MSAALTARFAWGWNSASASATKASASDIVFTNLLIFGLLPFKLDWRTARQERSYNPSPARSQRFFAGREVEKRAPASNGGGRPLPLGRRGRLLLLFRPDAALGAGLFDYLVGDLVGDGVVVRELHVEGAAGGGDGVELRLVVEHL